jgi:hypothetical protein
MKNLNRKSVIPSETYTHNLRVKEQTATQRQTRKEYYLFPSIILAGRKFVVSTQNESLCKEGKLEHSFSIRPSSRSAS